MKFNITDKELTKIMKNLVILCDTREKDNQAIISFFENKGIKYSCCTLAHGDYSAMLPKGRHRRDK